jgi:hypothetical protein
MNVRRHRNPIAAVIVSTIAIVLASPGHAMTYCVDTPTELQNALTAAAASTANDSIRIESGTYSTTASAGFNATLSAPGDLQISGGWLPGCIVRVGRSTIDGELARPGMTLLGSFDSAGLLRVSHLTFIHGRSAVESRSGGLTANPFIATELDVEVESCRFTDNRATHTTDGYGGGLFAVADGTLLVRNNVFADNLAQVAGGAAWLHCGTGVSGLTNNTIIDNMAHNGASTDVGGVALDGTCNAWEVTNNILWRNEGKDLALNAPGAVVRWNDLDDLGGTDPPATNTGNVNVDPLFESAGILRLTRGSPLVDAGFNDPFSGLPTESHDGGPRLVGPDVDIGAYELDRLFADDFDPLFGEAPL